MDSFLNRFIDWINQCSICCGRQVDDLYERLNKLEDEITRDPADDLRDIAASISNHTNMDLHVKVRLNEYGVVDQICVKYPSNDKYFKLPFDVDRNPDYIQYVLDHWFTLNEGGFCGTKELYYELEADYGDIENGITSIWLMNNADWIKFTKLNGKMYPSGYKTCRDNDLSNPYSSDEDN